MSGRAGAVMGGSLHTHHVGAHGHLSLHLKITAVFLSHSDKHRHMIHLASCGFSHSANDKHFI